jgi:hypothetical protein
MCRDWHRLPGERFSPALLMTVGRSNMPTGKKAGTAASKVLSSPKSTRTEKRAAASDLAQRPRPAEKGKKK